MISLVSPTRPAVPVSAAPVSGGWNLAALVQDMLRAWIAHYQRLADLGIQGEH